MNSDRLTTQLHRLKFRALNSNYGPIMDHLGPLIQNGVFQ